MQLRQRRHPFGSVRWELNAAARLAGTMGCRQADRAATQPTVPCQVPCASTLTSQNVATSAHVLWAQIVFACYQRRCQANLATTQPTVPSQVQCASTSTSQNVATLAHVLWAQIVFACHRTPVATQRQIVLLATAVQRNRPHGGVQKTPLAHARRCLAPASRVHRLRHALQQRNVEDSALSVQM